MESQLPDEQDESLKKLREIASKIGSGVNVNAADAAILGAGFYLGAVLNFRPGIDLPIVGYVGVPDVGAIVAQLKTQLRELKQDRETRLIPNVEYFNRGYVSCIAR